MTTDEAYAEVMKAVKDIEKAGVVVEITPTKQGDDPKLVARHSGPEHVSPDKWVSVEFLPKTDAHLELIHRKAKELGWLGIGFDTSGAVGCRDWQVDWSFQYTRRPDGDREASRDEVEDMLQDMEGS